ncbi:lactate racemase domain-containing protein [Gaiella sp.]|uniref:lactate racemase domain-containing protein n=1 Tax=Gaiella sp. TaxID=2663207 RepID=UPI0039833087
MARIPLLSGSRVPLVNLPDDVVLLTPPPPLEPLQDVVAAVGEALRYPLSGPPLSDLVTRGGRVTIVVEPPSLPLPGAANDPRQEAVAAAVDELERLGMPAANHTILIAGGLGRRAGRRELEAVLRPTRARDYRGAVAVHDASSLELQPLNIDGVATVTVHRALTEADLVVCVTAAETSERGGTCALLSCCGARSIASAEPAPSLLAPSNSPAGELAAAIATALGRRASVIGVSLVLDHPHLTGSHRSYPSSPRGLASLARSPLRRVLNVLPGPLREHTLQRLGREVASTGVLAGPPAVAHAEALLRGISLRGAQLQGQLDTLVVPLSWSGLNVPREPLNPITAAAISLGHGMRLWRDSSPLADGGTIVLLHDLRRTFGHGPQAPYRALFQVLRDGGTDDQLTAGREAAAVDERALAAYRDGRAPHPLLPYTDWASCRPALDHGGRVLVAGCRDAGSARALGFVPTHSTAAALDMARGVAGGSHRLGVLLGPPYPPVIVS